MPLGFWRDFRRHVKSINPESYLVAELWWETWPDHLLDPTPWLQGDVFDAAMNYRWYVPVRSFLVNAPPRRDARQLGRDLLATLQDGIAASDREMMNVAATHDTPRLATSLFNPGKYKHRVHPRANPDYRTTRPDAETRARQKQLLVLQFAWVGAPHIWYGDEVGMWGADDPDCRKPIIWTDVSYEDESFGPKGNSGPRNDVKPDQELLDFSRRLIRLRRDHATLLRDGTVEIREEENDDGDVWVLRRSNDSSHAIVIVNRSTDSKTRTIELDPQRAYSDLLDADFGVTGRNEPTGIPVSPRGVRLLVTRDP